MNKLVLGIIIAAAFVAGTVAMSIPAYAPGPPDDDGEGGWKAALENLPMTFYILSGDEHFATNVATISCDEGDLAVGGGGNANGELFASEPETNTTWIISSAPGSEAFRATVICADFDPPHTNS